MKNKIYYSISVLFFLLGGLFCNSTTYFDKNKYSDFYSAYANVDTLIFNNKTLGQTDTLVITYWDTIRQEGNLRQLSGKLFQIYSIQDGQEIVFISSYDSELSNQDDCMEIRYRDFWGCLGDTNNFRVDSLLSDFNIRRYWVISTNHPKRGLSENSIVEVLWSKEFGLTKYNLKNGSSFELKSGTDSQD